MLKLKVNRLVYLQQQPASARLSRSLLAGLPWLSWNPEMERKRSPLTSLLTFSLVYSWWKQDYVIFKKKMPHPNNKSADCLFQLLSFWEERECKQHTKMQWDATVLFGHVIFPFDEAFFVVLWQNSFNNRHCSLKNQTHLQSKPPGQCRCVPTSCIGLCIRVRLKQAIFSGCSNSASRSTWLSDTVLPFSGCFSQPGG